MYGLTSRQRSIYDFVVHQVQQSGIPPSLTEIATAFGLTSVAGIADHLKALEKKGYIRRRPGVPRGIVLSADDLAIPKSQPACRAVPLRGQVPSTQGLLEKAHDHVVIAANLVTGESLALQVTASGLNDWGLLPGDQLIVAVGKQPRETQPAVLLRRQHLGLALPGPGPTRAIVPASDGTSNQAFDLLGRVAAVIRPHDEPSASRSGARERG